MAIPNRTPEVYEALCRAYDETPGNHMRAATLAGIDMRSAKKCWELGWTDRSSCGWAHPIKNRANMLKQQARTILAEKQAKRVDETTEALTIAAKHAAEAYASEASVLKDVREGTGSLAKQFVSLAPALQKLTDRVALEVDRIASEDGDFDLAGALAILEAASKFGNRNLGTVKLVMEAERLHLGQPGEIIRHEHAQPAMSKEQLRREMEQLQEEQARIDAEGVPALGDGSTVE